MALPACSTGPTPAPVSVAPAQSEPDDFIDPTLVASACLGGHSVRRACARCLPERCSTDCSACGDDPNCIAMFRCVAGCEAAAGCEDRCLRAHPNFTFQRLVGPEGCMAVQCTSECGPPPKCQVSMQDEACNACLQERCMEGCARFSAGRGFDLLMCRLGCADAECDKTCDLEFADGVASYDRLLGPDGCMARSCGQGCQKGVR